TLREAGFNTLWCESATPPAVLDEAVKLGFWLVPALPVTASDPGVPPRLGSADAITQEVRQLLRGDAVLVWELGNGLASEQAPGVAAAAKIVRAADAQHPVGADVWDGFRSYSRNLDLISVHRWPLMTGLDLLEYHDWLNKRRLLARPGTFLWT